MSAPLVTFRWQDEDWAFEAQDVVEIVAARAVTPVPGLAARVLGIVTWRGRTLPVLLPQALKDHGDSTELKTRLLVLRRPGSFAVPVDVPGRVVDSPAAETVEWAGPGEAARPAGLRLVRIEDRLVRVLDPRALVEGLSSGSSHDAAVLGGNR